MLFHCVAGYIDFIERQMDIRYNYTSSYLDMILRHFYYFHQQQQNCVISLIRSSSTINSCPLIFNRFVAITIMSNLNNNSNNNSRHHTNQAQKSEFPNIPLFGGNGGESRIRRSTKLNEALKSYSNNREQQQQERSHMNIRAAKIGIHTSGNKPTAESGCNSNEHVSSALSVVNSLRRAEKFLRKCSQCKQCTYRRISPQYM